MNSSAFPRVSAGCSSLNAARCAVRTSLLLLAAAALLAPLAYWQLGTIGLAIVGAAAVTMLIAVLLSHVMERLFARTGHSMAGLLAAMTARMLVPLMFVLAVVVWEHPSVPTWSAMYIAPLYFVMLVAETVFALRRCHSAASPTMVARQS